MSSFLKTVQFIEDTFKMVRDTGLAHRSGQMLPSMKVDGKITRQMAQESFGTLTGTYTTDSGKTTKPMAMVFIFT